MRIALQEDLNRLQADVQNEGELVLRSLRGAVNALRTRDLELADEVIAFDDEVDGLYFSIAEGIYTLLARQTPVAIDLRVVLATLHINLHLERMADYCVTISKLTKLVAGVEPDEDLVHGFDEMGTRAEEMIRVALASFESRDLDGATSDLKLTKLVAGVEPDEDLVHGFDEMGTRAEEMIRVALASFESRDLDGAT